MAMFPVGGYYMQRGEISDRGSAIAQAAFNDAVTSGVLNPQNWYVMIPEGAGNTPTTPPITISPIYRFSADPRNISTGFGSLPLQSTYTRPLAATLAESKSLASGLTNNDLIISKHFGSAYVIDPMGVASFAWLGRSDENRFGYSFPATSRFDQLPVSVYAAYSSGWNPWKTWINASTDEDTWPIRRVTLHQASPIPGLQYHEPMKAAVAERLFSSQDDLAMDVPDRGDMPTLQNWDAVDSDNDGEPDLPLARQSRGDYSWIITVVPKTVEARDALASHGGSHAYDVSVVVFYKRVLSRSDPGATDPANSQAESRQASDLLAQQERAVRTQIVSTGLSGGEVLLTAYDENTANDDGLGTPFTNLKVGEWIMLCGPHPQSTNATPRFVLNWYRVLAVEGKDTKLDDMGNPTTATNEPERRLVSLRGPQWPWQPDLSYASSLSNWLCGAICPGAVAVHNQTVQLEGTSPWSVE
jgi:hypothetical protein